MASAGGARSKSLDLGRVMGREQAMEGCYWGADHQEKAESCVEQEDNVHPSQWAAGLHLVVRQLLGLEDTCWEAVDAAQKPEGVGSVQAVVPVAAEASLELLQGSTSHWEETVVAPGAGRAFAKAAEACWA